jgi:arylsulfatase A-like enzyme
MSPDDSDPPNVLLLLTDQERYDVLTDSGPTVDTPNLDRLRREGAQFSRAYTPISICSSARASVLSGLLPHNHGMLNNCHGAEAVMANLPPDVVTFGDLLAQEGYENTYLGKWHVGRDQGPGDFGFEYLGGSDQHHDRGLASDFREYQAELGVDPDEDYVSDPVYADAASDPTLIAGTSELQEEATRPYYLATRTIERLEEWANVDGPQFHRTDFLGPHHPYVVPEPFASMYDPESLEPWPSYQETYDGKPAAQERYLTYRGVAEFDWQQWSVILAKYLGFVTFIDEQIGRVLDALDEQGLAPSTVVVHAADHGDFVGGHRQFNKGAMMYEDTYRVPLLVRWPDVVPEDTTRREFVSLVDLMPTFVDLAGGTVPDGLDGRSLLPLLGDEHEQWRSAVFAEYHGDENGFYSQRMVRTDAYKFVLNTPDANELYDLERDPAELRNLVDHPEYQGVRRRLAGKLLEKMAETDDPLHTWTVKHLEHDAPS